jgi:putative ABC transport system substrate-binding protein
MALAGGAAALPGTGFAQQGRVLRVGTVNVQPRASPNWQAFERRMSELGYFEGRNFIFDHVQVLNVGDWDALCREMVARKPDVILAGGPEQSLTAAKAAAGAAPIVMMAVDYDPLARGHVASLARPGGTVTGVYFQTAEFAGKHLQLMREIVPGLTSATVLWDRLATDYWRAMAAAAEIAGVRLNGVELDAQPYDYERALAGASAIDARVVFALASPFFFRDRARLSQAALGSGSALMVQLREGVTVGGLVSYGAKITDMWALAATYVDRLAKGARPDQLAVQQPTQFELVLNLGTAKTLGLTIPPSLLARADEVVE